MNYVVGGVCKQEILLGTYNQRDLEEREIIPFFMEHYLKREEGR